MRRALGRITDLVAIIAAVLAMTSTTPLGGWITAQARHALGRPEQKQGLARWFNTGQKPITDANEVAVRLDVVAQPPREDTPESQVAARVGLRRALARGVLVMAAEGRADAAGHLDVTIPASADHALAEAGLSRPPPGSSDDVEAAILIETVARLVPKLGSETAAVAALASSPVAVRGAIGRARALDVEDPTSWDGFGHYLPASQRRSAAPFVRGAMALATAYELGSPLERIARVSSPFGNRVHPVLGSTRMHTGVDLPVVTGTSILAVGPGVVTHAGEDSVNGKFIRIDHGHGLTSAYCHASELLIAKHDRVTPAAVIARSGNTGRSTGPHLHFQLEIDRVPVDPSLFLEALSKR